MDKQGDYKGYRGEIAKKGKTGIGDLIVWLGDTILLVLRAKYLIMANQRRAKWDFTLQTNKRQVET